MFLASNEIIKIYVEPFLKFYTARSELYVIRTIYWKRQRLNVNQPRRYSSDIFIIQWHTGVQRNAVWPNRKWRWLVLRVHAVSAFQLVPLSWHQMRNRMSSQAGAARQCVRHARYRQYPPIRFSSLFRSPGDRTPTPHYRLHRFTILPRLQHNRVFITTSTQPRAPLSSLFFSFHFSVSMTNNETFNEVPLRLHRYSLRRLSPRMFSELLCQSFSVSSLLLLFLELSS